jgi:sugar lactone lactonase YvrE
MKKLLIISASLLLLLYRCSKSPKNNMVTPVITVSVATYAGNGTAGLQNGSALSAEFNLPIDVVLDLSGNLYVAEQGNNVIRKISPAGVVSTYAGDGTAGYKDGAALSAEFNGPEGMVVDDVGNLYVSDSQNNVIREITPLGAVSTYAGDGIAGYKDGAALSAEFAGPNGLAIDKSRNIYVADFFNNVIRAISNAGQVITYAGNGTPGLQNGAASSAEFHIPSGIALDGSGNLYVAEASNKAIRKIAPGGAVSTYASNFTSPVRVAIDVPGNLYVSDNNTIKKVTSEGTVSNYAGNGTAGFVNGVLLSAEFNTPIGIASDALGNLAIADYGNNRIRVIAP